MSWQSTIRRAEKADLKVVFHKYASVEVNGEKYMSLNDFVCKYLGLLDPELADQETMRRLGAMADTTQDDLISFVEFRSFESLLCAPDAVNQLAFKLFDLSNVGKVSFENFKKVLGATSLCQAVPFDFDCSFLHHYFGRDKSHNLDYYDFCQLVQHLPTEHARQAFSLRDTDKTGTIPAVEFIDIMKKIRGFRMTEHVQDHLLSVAGGSAGRRVSYAYFKAFNQMLGNLGIFRVVVQSVCDHNPQGRCTHVQLLRQSQDYPQITPLQVSLLFDLCSMDQQTGTIGMEEFRKLVPWPHQVAVAPHTVPASATSPDSSSSSGMGHAFFMGVLEQVYRFVLGGAGGATGATAVYPIDLVKTRMQNQRGSYAGEIMYQNSIDCFKKVLKHEGFFGLYRGLLPQLIGVSPEKAIKLTANDFMRDTLRKIDGKLPLYRECIAGGCGGMCQVMFTNPIEIVKIRMQVAGEMGGSNVPAVRVIRELGFLGLYKGARACLMRDIPFSAIYFPVYAHMKIFTADENSYNGPVSLFLSAMTAGVPAAYLCTPADVIKTRLQVKAREGQETYVGIANTAKKIWNNEGFRAFWKGGPARVFRSAPQFGVTLMTYELLQRLFYVDFGKGPKPQPVSSFPPTGLTPSSTFSFPDHIGGYRLAHSTFSNVESRFGLVFPKVSPKAVATATAAATPAQS